MVSHFENYSGHLS